MKLLRSKWLVIPLVLSLLAACGSGGSDGGGADTLTATLGDTALSFVEAADPASDTGYDPDVSAIFDILSPTTYITAFADHNLSDFEVKIFFSISGYTTGSYPVSGSTFSYRISSTGESYSALAGSGSIEITAYGPVGGRIEGTFSFEVCASFSDRWCASPLPFEGSFSIVRDQ